MHENSVFQSEEGRDAILAVYRSLLDQWPVPCEKFFVNTRHGDIFVIASGDVSLPPLFLLHGSSSNSAMWIGDIARYSRDYRVYALDLPGEPGLSTDIRPDLTTSAYSEWMEDVFRELCIEKASIVGISLGGWLALKFATACPDKVDKLALLCPAGIGPQKFGFLLVLLPLKLFGRRGERMAIRYVMGMKELSDETIEYSRLISKNYRPFMGTVPIFRDEELQSLTCPILLIAGAKDVMIDSAKTIRRASQVFSDVHAVLLPGTGHALVNQADRTLSFLSAK